MLNNIIPFLALNFLITSCVVKDEVSLVAEHSNLNFDKYCIGEPEIRNGRRTYGETSESDEIGIVRRYEYYKTQNSEECKRGQIPLSHFEKGIRRRAEKKIKCTPQTELSSKVYLKAANNFYEYRNNKYFLHLDPSTGTFRRIILGEDKNGKSSHIKEIGCFWTRQDNENELWEAQNYGLQILLDQANSATSNNTQSFEVYSINRQDNQWTLQSINETTSWSELFCPFSSTPWGYCNLIRNGNLMYPPSNLTRFQKNELINHAILIRGYYNFLETTNSNFDEQWKLSMRYEGEKPEMDFKYRITFAPDVPIYTINAWVDYVRDLRPMMPEVIYGQVPPYCYLGVKEVTLNDGSRGFIKGEICYIDGVYRFTQN